MTEARLRLGDRVDTTSASAPAAATDAWPRRRRRRPGRGQRHDGRRRAVTHCRVTGSTRSSAGSRAAHAQLTFDRAARGRVLLDNASTRLDEVEQLSATTARATAQIGETLDDVQPRGRGRRRPAGRRLPGERRPVVDDDAAHLHRDQHGPPARAPAARCRPARSTTSCCRPPRRSTRSSRCRSTPARAAPGHWSARCRPVLTQVAPVHRRLLAGRAAHHPGRHPPAPHTPASVHRPAPRR